MTLDESLTNAATLHEEIWRAFAGSMASLGLKTSILLAYASLALEHHEAITLLVRRGLFGSALALARPVFEIMWRSGWVQGCATPEQIEKISRDQFSFPNARKMVSALDKVYQTGTYFRRLHLRIWTPLNSYTHSGKFQLASRFTGNDLTPSYSDEEKMMAVNSTLVAAAMTAILVLKAHQRMEDASRIESILGRLDLPPIAKS